MTTLVCETEKLDFTFREKKAKNKQANEKQNMSTGLFSLTSSCQISGFFFST